METERYVTMMEDVYRFVMYASDDYNTPHDYGTGSILNRVEMHTLAMIAAAPGICITDVARMWNRTLGAASKNVNRLCSKGYVEKRKLPGNDKTIHLHPTPEGEKLAKLHRQFDLEQGHSRLKSSAQSTHSQRTGNLSPGSAFLCGHLCKKTGKNSAGRSGKTMM